MVERMIGQKHGTGGSPGARYLEGTLAYRFFPELWEVRTYLGEGTYA
jgi:tryptophan 2,3-dioxygenase